MLSYIPKYIQPKTLSGYKFSNMEVKKQEVLKEEIQSSKRLNYPIINKSSKKVKWDRCH